MMMPRYRLDSDLSEADREFIDDQLRQFNHVTAPPVQEPLRRLINLAVRDENNVIRVGGFWATCTDTACLSTHFGWMKPSGAKDMAKRS